MKIFFNKELFPALDKSAEKLLRQTLATVAKIYNLPAAAEVSVTLADDEKIREINRDWRGLDEVTDVISFALDDGEQVNISGGPDEHLLGELVLCVPQAGRQAEEYGHSFERELAYLAVHGMLHILGYDHAGDEEKAAMREEEELVLRKLGLARGGSGHDLLAAARAAQANAYAPYSGFKVGAAVRTDTGRIFNGCNVENASYGLTVCAERAAVFSAVAAGCRSLEEILLVSDSAAYTAPCGACRQVMLEFGIKLVYMADKFGNIKTCRLAKLLPLGFSRDNIGSLAP